MHLAGKKMIFLGNGMGEVNCFQCVWETVSVSNWVYKYEKSVM